MTFQLTAEPMQEHRQAGSMHSVCIIIVSLCAMMAAVAWREPIVQTIPRAAAAYGAIGLKVNLSRFDFDKVTARITQEPSRRLLLVEGEVFNPTAIARETRPIRVNLRGADKQILYSWTVRAPKPHLNPGERANFSAKLAAPPPEAQEAVVSFEEEAAKAAIQKPSTNAAPHIK